MENTILPECVVFEIFVAGGGKREKYIGSRLDCIRAFGVHTQVDDCISGRGERNRTGGLILITGIVGETVKPAIRHAKIRANGVEGPRRVG